MVATLQYYDGRNPDDSFVLHGRTPRFSERPKTLTSSELTTTTRGLGASPNNSYTPERYSDTVNVMYDDMSGDPTLRTRFLYENEHNLRNNYRNESQTNLSHSEEYSDITSGLDTFGGEAKSVEESGWYNYPMHLSRCGADFPVFQSLGVSTHSISPIQRNAGKLGATIDAEKKCRDISLDKNSDRLSFRDYHYLSRGRDYSTSIKNYEREFHNPVPKRSQSPTFRTVSNRSTSAFKQVPKRSASPSHHTRSQSFRSGSNRHSSGTITTSPVRTSLSELHRSATVHDNLERPFTTEENFQLGWPLVSFCSPYAPELSRLRMEQLRLEEDTLLQMKREQELERIRAPKGKWYELKGPEFHYEAHKNNELLRLSSSLTSTDLRRYRNELTNASTDFQQSLGKVI